MRISHNYIIVFYLLFAFIQISADELSKIPKVQKEYDFMCGCKHIFYKNQFEPSENQFFVSTQSTTVAYNGQSNKVETNRWSEFSDLIIPDEVVECFMAGKYSRLTGYFLTEPKKYFKITAEYQLDGSGVWKTLEIKKFPGAPFWKKFDYYFDLVNMPTTKKVKIKVQSPIDLGENETEDQIYSLYLDEFRICKYCDGVVSVPLPALKKLEANTGELVTLSENNFKLSVSTGTSNLKIKPVLEPSFAGSTIKVNGSTVSSGSFSQDIYLDPDPDKSTFIYVEVSQSVCERNLYVVEVKKPEGPDATLSNLKTSEGSISPSFYRFQNNYTILIPKEISTLKLIPFANDSKATIKVDSNKVETGTETGSINVSNNRVITIEVTARDGITKRNYTVTVLHEGPRITFVTASSSGIESNANPVISVSITPPPDSGQTMTVQVITTGGMAEEGEDFTLSPIVLTFTNTNLIQSFNLNIIDDTIGEPEETITLSLANVTGGAIIGKKRTHEYTIIDNETAIWVRSDIVTPGNGATWNTAFKYLQDALNAAKLDRSIKTIRIAKGYYYPDQYHDSLNNFVDSNNECISFELRDNIALVGGYITESKRDSKALNNQTYLDGNLEPNSELYTSNHIIKFNSSGSKSYLYSLTLQNGFQKGPGCGRPEGAGAIYLKADKLKLVDCNLRNNKGRDMGAIYVENGTLMAKNCIFESNTSNNGGAILARGPMHLENCLFYDNIATTGGAILIQNDSRALHKMVGCKFYNQKMSSKGAAISYNGNGSLEINSCIFNDNKSDLGGAIYIGSNPVNFIVENSMFENNAATNGSAIYIENGASNISQTYFSNNYCNNPDGAAINYFVCGPNHILSGCIFLNNQSMNHNCP